jgi:hypothetical protein
MSGQWPPEWEDSDTGLPDEWDIDDTELDLQSSMVTSFLASVPSPVLPSAFEARISAAIAAEATARAEGTGSAGTDIVTTGPVDAETTDRSSSPEGSSPAATESRPGTSARRRRRTSAAVGGTGRGSGPAGSRPGGRRRRRLRMPSAAVSASLIIVLAVAGFAVLISQFGSGSSYSSSEAASGAAGTSVSSPAAEPAASSAHGPNGRYSASQSGPSAFRDGLGAPNLKFSVTKSGISYQGSTLATQVQTQLTGGNAVTPAASEPSASSSTEASASAPPPANTAPPLSLKGCVAHFTNGLAPSLVDRSTYDGIPAYIIAVPSRVWVVRLGCTAADPQEITSVPLSGLSGNLSALGSVEGYASPGERRMQ